MIRDRLTKRMKTAAVESRKDKKNTGKGELRRELEGFEYDKSKAKVLKDALHNINVSLGTLMAAMKQLSMLRGSDITPDGRIGGRGFIMEFKEMKRGISDAVSSLSDVTDSLADELKNPGWGLTDAERRKVERVIQETEDLEEEVDDIVEETEPEKSEESDQEEEDSVEDDMTSEEDVEKDSTIGPEMVRDSDVLERYRDLLGSSAKDRVASVLSKSVLANLSL